MKARLIIAALAAAFCLLAGLGQASAEQLDFDKIPSPIIFRGDEKFAYRDPAVVYADGHFYLYFTLCEMAPDGGYYARLGYSRSTDLVHWTFPRTLTPRDRKLNCGSPGNVIRRDGEWIICLQTYPTPNGGTFGTKDSRIWIMRSKDLENWSDLELLRVKGNDVPVEKMGRMIDPYLIEDADEPGRWWCFYKQRGVSMSHSTNLKDWTYVGRASAGENVTILRHGGEYVMFHSPSNGIGVKRSKDLSHWGKDVDHLTLGQKQWPWSHRRLTAATVVDLTRDPRVGKFVMFFHGDSPAGARLNRAHGSASIALAYSDDLVHWDWPGKKEADDKKSAQ